MTLAQIPIYVITLAESPYRSALCADRLASQGVSFKFWHGVHGERAGLATTNSYEVDAPGSKYKIEHRHLGIYVSHWILWQCLHFAPSAPAYMIVEDDADFHPGWQERVDATLGALPEDWDYLAPGNCDCGTPAPETAIAPGLYETRPLCTHCYIIRASSLPKVIDPLRKIWAPLDLALYFDAFPKMRVFSILPRCVGQVGMSLNP